MRLKSIIVFRDKWIPDDPVKRKQFEKDLIALVKNEEVKDD